MLQLFNPSLRFYCTPRLLLTFKQHSNNWHDSYARRSSSCESIVYRESSGCKKANQIACKKSHQRSVTQTKFGCSITRTIHQYRKKPVTTSSSSHSRKSARNTEHTFSCFFLYMKKPATPIRPSTTTTVSVAPTPVNRDRHLTTYYWQHTDWKT